MVNQKDKVSDVIEVLTVIKNERESSSRHQNTTQLRILATKVVAEKEFKKNRYSSIESANYTIRDAYCRRLRPDIQNTGMFDMLVDEWLTNGSMELKNILLGHTVSGVQSSIVEKFFTNQ